MQLEKWVSLHQRLVQMQIGAEDRTDVTIVVIPSMSLEDEEIRRVKGFYFYEERLLYYLLKLQHPKTKIIYVASRPIAPELIDYYLAFLGDGDGRDRLVLFTLEGKSSAALSQQLIADPKKLAQLKTHIDPGKTYMSCFTVAAAEQALALALDIPLFGSDLELAYWGTKAGSRQIFAEQGIPHPDGCGSVTGETELIEAIALIESRHPHGRLMLKLNVGFSGTANGLLDLRSLLPDQRNQPHLIQELLPQLQFAYPGKNWSQFSKQMARVGAIAEAFVEGDEKRSPSVQGCIKPDGTVEIVSTHEQILSQGMVFLGCQFPADVAYRQQLHTYGELVGQSLAARGALEKFSVDFVAVRRGKAWLLEAIEINLRKGGTTHPMMLLRYLTQGSYGPDGRWYDRHGQPKFYWATDNLQKEQYIGLSIAKVIALSQKHRLNFNRQSQTGIVFHLLGSLPKFGKLGVTCIGNSPEMAHNLYLQLEHLLDQASPSNQQAAV